MPFRLRIVAILFVLLIPTLASFPLSPTLGGLRQPESAKDSSPAQTVSVAPVGSEVVERLSRAVVLILFRRSGAAEGYASGVIVRTDGVLLTSYHVVKGATAVQIRLKNGEVFDNVQLVGFDERRDIAALRIPATGLDTVPIAGSSEVKPGEEVYVISNPEGLAWTTSSGIFSSVRMADEVSGAGQGYRLVQFTAAISPGSSGGVLADKQGRALGIVVGSLGGGQNLNFAVPIESVIGLAQMSGRTALASGAGLQVRRESPSLPSAEPREPPVRQGGFPVSPGVEPPVQPINPAAPELSSAIESRGPTNILRTFRTIYVISKTVWLPQELMQETMAKQTALSTWGIVIVSDPKIADARLTVNRLLFTWTWTYELVHQNTGIVLDTGKMNATTGGLAAGKIAESIVKRISSARGKPEAPAPSKKP